LTQASIGNSTGIKFPSTSSFSRFHAAGEGQFASDGRRRRIPQPTRVAFRRSALPASRARFFAAPHTSRAHSGPSAAIPDRFKNVLLSMELGILPRLPATPLNRYRHFLILKDFSHRAISGFSRHSGFDSVDICEIPRSRCIFSRISEPVSKRNGVLVAAFCIGQQEFWC
jgi:hypothetical protein